MISGGFGSKFNGGREKKKGRGTRVDVNQSFSLDENTVE